MPETSDPLKIILFPKMSIVSRSKSFKQTGLKAVPQTFRSADCMRHLFSVVKNTLEIFKILIIFADLFFRGV